MAFLKNFRMEFELPPTVSVKLGLSGKKYSLLGLDLRPALARNMGVRDSPPNHRP